MNVLYDIVYRIKVEVATCTGIGFILSINRYFSAVVSDFNCSCIECNVSNACLLDRKSVV